MYHSENVPLGWISKTLDLHDFSVFHHSFTDMASVEKGSMELRLVFPPSTAMERFMFLLKSKEEKETRGSVSELYIFFIL